MPEPAIVISAVIGLAAVGAVAGLMAGLLGVGGGVLFVPAIYFAAGLFGTPDVHRAHLAVGTSLAVIIVTATQSLRAHWRLNAVDTGILRVYGPGVLVGTALGTGVASIVSGKVLTAVFAVAALAVAANMARGEPARKLGDVLPGPVTCAAMGLFTGVVATLAGIGGGATTVAMLTLYSTPIHRAVGTAAAVGVIVAVPGALGFGFIGWGESGLPPASLGYVNLAAFAMLAPITAVVAPIGARLAHRLARTALARIFAAFLALGALNMLWDILHP